MMPERVAAIASSLALAAVLLTGCEGRYPDSSRPSLPSSEAESSPIAAHAVATPTPDARTATPVPTAVVAATSTPNPPTATAVPAAVVVATATPNPPAPTAVPPTAIPPTPTPVPPAPIPVPTATPATAIFQPWLGSTVVAADGEYLGVLGGRFGLDSICNPFSTYGSRYSLTSVRNPYGTYGSQYSLYSAYSRYTSTPPKIVSNGVAIGYLTKNPYLAGAVDPDVYLSSNNCN
jgi:hypothetical protein